MTKEEFRQFCKTAWKKQHGFVIIDLSSKKHDGRIEAGSTSFTYRIEIKNLLLFSHLEMENLLKQIVNNTEPKRSF